MNDRLDRDDWRHERSLRELGRAMRGEDEVQPSSGSLLSLAQSTAPDWRDNAVERHQIARTRREAIAERDTAPIASIPPLEEPRPSVSAPPEMPDNAPKAADDQSPASSWLPRWAQLKRAQALPEDVAAKEPLAPPVPPAQAADPEPERKVVHEGYERTVSPFAATPDKGDRWKPLIDPMKIIGGITRSKALILAMTLLGAVAGVSIALSTPKKYEALTELIVDPRDLKITESDLTQTMIASDATLAIVENQMRVLTSGVVLNKVVDTLNLTSDPEFNGQNGRPGLLAMARSLLSRDDGPAGADDVRRRALAVSNLAESIHVERGGKTFVITVSATTQNADKSALIANTMTDVFLQTYGQIQSETAGRATNELTARLTELRKGVEDAERKVEQFRATHDLVDAQGRLISDDELLKLNEQLTVARARTLELSARAASTKTVDVDAVLGGALPEEMNSNTMADLRSQYSTLKQEADRAAVRLGPRHPERIALDAQLAGARDRIAAELRRIASSLQVDLRRAVQLEQELSARLAQLKVRSGDVSNDLVSLREFEREAAAKRSVYEAFLLRAKETSERKDINTANVSVISKAFPPLEPNGPSRAIVALAGLLLGFASGVGLGAMRGAYESLRETAADRARQGRQLQRRETPLDSPNRSQPAEYASPAVSATGSPSPTGREPVVDEIAEEEPSVEEIRASLREVRDALHELAESRARNRQI